MATKEFRRRLAAILSADVEGYSRLMRDDEEATIRTLTTYREAMTNLIQHYRGRVVDSPGDNLLSEFGSVVDAVSCAVEVQRELAERNAELPENRRMPFRIGVNLGDVIEEGERIYGDGINIAARMEGLAEGGGICISGTVYDAIEKKIGLEHEYLGEQEIKNIDKPVRAYRVLSYPGAAAHRVVKAKKAVGRTWRNVVMTITAVLILVAGAWAIWNFYFRPPAIEPAAIEKMAYPLPEKPSIAVLPFVNMSGDPEQEHIGDCITENLTTVLSYIPEMFVIARTSTSAYKGKAVKVKQVSEELGVRYVLEGSVMKAGDRIRVTVQLIDAISGHHLWADRYDRDIDNFFDLLDEIAKKVVIELQVKLTEGDIARLSHKTENFEAWAYATTAYSLLKRTTKENNAKARELCEKAVKLDSGYGYAWGALGAAHSNDAAFGWSKYPDKSFKLAVEYTDKALKLDKTLSCSTAIKGNLHMRQRQIEQAIAVGEKAIALGPSHDLPHMQLSNTMRMAGRFKESITLMKKAMRLNPHYPAWSLSALANCYFMEERYEEAIEAWKRVLERAQKGEYVPLFPLAGLSASYMELGRKEEARAYAAEVLKLYPKFSLDYLRHVNKNAAHYERFLEALRKAGLPEKPPVAVPEKPSIAVLPFANISGDPKEDYLSDGITENIITALSKTPKMLVIARNSVFTYKGKPVMVQQVSEELGVRYVLEGSVQKSRDRLRITAQLIDAKTGNHLWSERYDRDLKDLFELQDEITKNVITALQVKLTQGEIVSIHGKGTKNLEAYLKQLKGLHLFFRFNKNDNETARRLTKEAIALDPFYANAYVLLAWTCLNEARFQWTKTPAKSLEKAMELAKKAISLDEKNGLAYLVFANVFSITGQYEKALVAAKKGISLDPTNSNNYATYGIVLYNSGKFNEEIGAFKEAISRDPIPQSWYVWLMGLGYFKTGQNEEAIAILRKCVNRYPRSGEAHACLGVALIAVGRSEEAIPMFEKALSLNPQSPGWFSGNLALALVGAGQPEKAITMLRELLRSDLDNTWFLNFLSMALSFEGKYEEALSKAKKGIDLDEARFEPHRLAELYNSLGVSYLMMGEHKESIAAFNKAIDILPEYMDAHIGLTASYNLAGFMEEARAQTEEILKINPKITLADIAKNGYFNFKGADKELFINALRKAGLK